KNWNKALEERVETQLAEIERIRRLERFLAPQVAQLIASSDGHDALLDSHRREVTVVFCDLRGFTAFTEATEPEEAMNVLREYHAALGELIFRYEGRPDRRLQAGLWHGRAMGRGRPARRSPPQGLQPSRARDGNPALARGSRQCGRRHASR